MEEVEQAQYGYSSFRITGPLPLRPATTPPVTVGCRLSRFEIPTRLIESDEKQRSVCRLMMLPLDIQRLSLTLTSVPSLKFALVPARRLMSV